MSAISKISSLLIMATLLGATSWAASALPLDINGQWSGVMRTEDGKRTRVQTKIGAQAISLHFGEPANCSIEGLLLDTEKSTTVYRFKVPQNGGPFCSGLYPGDVLVKPDSSATVRMSFTRSAVPWSALLHRAIEP